MIKIDEKHFEDILFENLQTEDGIINLNQRGFDITYDKHALLFTQLNLREYGIPDIIRVWFWGKSINIDIIELKVTEFNLSHLIQLGRYVAGINQIISDNKTLLHKYVNIQAFLIVSAFNSENDNVWIGPLLRNSVKVYSTTYSLDGMFFECELPGQWSITKCDTRLQNFVNVDHLKSVFKEAYKSFIQNPDELEF